MTDTIFALATPPGRGAVAVVRLSGPRCGAVLEALSGPLPSPRRASVRRLTDPEDGDALDDALVLWMPGPGSYTGEDCVELHLHGGPAVVDAVTRAVARLGPRLAEPGEFTRRAFEAGRLDLAQAEAVADLVEAETAGQRAQALRQLDGALSQRYGAWRNQLVDALAFLDAAVDFPDEDLPEALAEQVRPRLEALAADLRLALVDADRGARVRDGFRIALVGAPNAGKSTLLNRLAGRDLAIVTAAPGTTRDVIEASLVVGGFKVVLADMAGLREVTEVVEAEGVRRARAWARDADLRLWIVDGSSDDEAWREGADLVGPGDICVINKADSGPATSAQEARTAARTKNLRVVDVSALHGYGVADLSALLQDLVASRLGGHEFPAATRLRHRARLDEAAGHVDRALDSLADAELAAEDLRLAARALAQIAGRVDAEQVLDVVFGSFCIGK